MSESERTRNAEAGDRVMARGRRSGWVRRQFSDILYVARRDKKWSLLPLFFLLLLLSLLLIAASTVGPLAPFIYPFL